MKQIQLHAGMGPAIVDHLRHFGDLPTRGIVAGQAVASAVQDLFGDGNGKVYNDVDIFRPLASHRLMKERRRNTLNDTVELKSSHLPTTRDDEYGALEDFLASIRSYQLSSVSSQGMLNFVNCVLPGGVQGDWKLSSRRVIDSFDLNSTRVAVDLETGLMSWDRHFERFLSTRQLEIVAVHTPWHTFLRMLKKVEELPDVYADLATSAEICAAFSRSMHLRTFTSKGAVSDRFGAKARALAERTQSRWETYFELAEHSVAARDGSSGTLYSMRPRGAVDGLFQSITNDLKGAAIHYASERLYSARRKNSPKTMSKVEAVQAWAVAHESRHLRRLVDIRQEAFVAGQVTERHVTEVAAAFKQHPALARALSPMTLSGQLEAVRELRRLSNAHGPWVFGIVEMDRSFVGELRAADLESLVERHKKEQMTPFDIEPLALSCLPKHWAKAGILVEELLTPGELTVEGDALSHCVGGYASAVRENRSRIIRIRTGGSRAEWSTMEVIADAHVATRRAKLGPTAALYKVQHRGFANKEPAPLNKAVADYLLKAHGKSRLHQLGYSLGIADACARLMRTTAAKISEIAFAMERFSADMAMHISPDENNPSSLRRQVNASLRARGGAPSVTSLLKIASRFRTQQENEEVINA